MSGSSPLDSPWIIGLITAAWGTLVSFGLYLLKQIRQAETDSMKVAETVKHDLTQAVIAAAAIRDRETDAFRAQMDARFRQMDDRFDRGDTERDFIREENRRNHAENAGRLDRIMERMANLATRADVQDMRGIRHDTGD